MDLAKFLNLLQSSRLYFCRADCFEDPYEGMMSDDYAEAMKAGNSNLSGDFAHQNAVFAQFRESHYVNSWHLSECEPAGFWKLYAGMDSGVAVCSSFSRLQCAFKQASERYYIGLVNYDSQSQFGTMNSFKFIMHKRSNFAHEREVRAMIWKPDPEAGNNRHFDADNRAHPMPLTPPRTPRGLALKADLHQLLTRVVVSPTAQTYVVDVVREVVGRYGYGFEVEQSELYLLKYLPRS